MTAGDPDLFEVRTILGNIRWETPIDRKAIDKTQWEFVPWENRR
jgi:hypothetical protein